MEGPGTVVDETYVAQEDLTLSVARKIAQISGGDFAITDAHGKALFKLKGSHVTLHEKRTLYDQTETAVLTLHKKLITMHDTWEAYKGETDDTVFSVKKAHMTDRGGVEAYEVFVAGSSDPDYVIKGDFDHRSYSIVYREEFVAAEIGKKLWSISSFFGGKNKYGVKVNSGVDLALVAAVVVIIDSVHQEDKDSKGEGSSSDSD